MTLSRGRLQGFIYVKKWGLQILDSKINISMMAFVNPELQQYLPVLLVVGGVIAVGLFVKKTGWIGVFIVGALAVVWIMRSNPEWFDGLDGTMERIVKVNRPGD